MNDIIAAVSTPPGNGAIGIVRLSGQGSAELARRVFTGGPMPWPSHKALFGRIADPRGGEQLDQGLLLFMQGPHSYTGEDMIELHCHGGRFLVQAVLNLLLELGARPAEPGEFTQRAFLNGRMDLTQAEAVADLIHGQSRKGLHLAAHQLDGHLSKPIRQVRHDLIALLASIEANIDFPDEVDPPDPQLIKRGMAGAQAEIARLLATSYAGRIWKEGLKLAIVGEPNVGKSTLLNALLRYERAIVTEIAGTTRDTIEDDYNLRGIPVRIIDTAGLRETSDRVESIGIERSRKAVSEADLVLVVADASQGLAPELASQLPGWRDKDLVLIWNKSDLDGATASPAIRGLDEEPGPAGASAVMDQAAFETWADANQDEILRWSDRQQARQELADFVDSLPSARVSSLRGEGLDALEDLLFEIVNSRHELSPPISINDRHRLCLLRARESLERMSETLRNGLPMDFVAIDLKEAIVAFGEVIGESVHEEVINEIFHRFCVGK